MLSGSEPCEYVIEFVLECVEMSTESISGRAMVRNILIFQRKHMTMN